MFNYLIKHKYTYLLQHMNLYIFSVPLKQLYKNLIDLIQNEKSSNTYNNTPHIVNNIHGNKKCWHTYMTIQENNGKTHIQNQKYTS